MIQNKLIDKVDMVGASLRKQVEYSCSKKSGITGVRGLGTSIYIDTIDGQTAQKLQQHLLKEGVLTKLNGQNGIAAKPSLLFDQKHADLFTAALSRF